MGELVENLSKIEQCEKCGQLLLPFEGNTVKVCDECRAEEIEQERQYDEHKESE